MRKHTDLVRLHYRQPRLSETILAALAESGISTEALSLADLAELDEFHLGGRSATMQLGRLACLRHGERVLDLGCAIGGPARTLAAEFWCRVVGLDLVAEYVAAARMLTEHVGLSDTVLFCEGDSREVPFGDGEFDVVWSQHTLVNLPRKADVLSEASRVLAAGGRLSLYEVCSGPGGAPVLPLPWASDTSISHLVPADGLCALIEAHGFEIEARLDLTSESLEWLQRAAAARVKAPKEAPRRPTLRLLMGPDAALKSKNMQRNLDERRIEVVMVVALAPP